MKKFQISCILFLMGTNLFGQTAIDTELPFYVQRYHWKDVERNAEFSYPFSNASFISFDFYNLNPSIVSFVIDILRKVHDQRLYVDSFDEFYRQSLGRGQIAFLDTNPHRIKSLNVQERTANTDSIFLQLSASRQASMKLLLDSYFQLHDKLRIHEKFLASIEMNHLENALFLSKAMSSSFLQSIAPDQKTIMVENMYYKSWGLTKSNYNKQSKYYLSCEPLFKYSHPRYYTIIDLKVFKEHLDPAQSNNFLTYYLRYDYLVLLPVK